MEFKKTLEEKVGHINDILMQFTPSEEGRFKKICDAVRYSVKAGGKRLRPLLLQETFILCGGKERFNEEDCHPFMSAMELIHTYSLVHDDLPAMDNDLLRRGLPTTHAKFGEDFGILAGDGLLNTAYEIMLDKICGSWEIRFARAAKEIADNAGIFGMVGGQCLDVELTGKEINKDDLDFIFRYKTGALLRASLTAGGHLAGVGEKDLGLLTDAGNALGLAFQIRDDILDCIGSEDEIGKPVGSDERNNKTTYVSLYGLEKAEEDVHKYTESATESLKQIGDNQFLFELIKYMASRTK